MFTFSSLMEVHYEMNRMHKMICIVIFSLTLGVSFIVVNDSNLTFALPEQVVIRGRQERGYPGRNAVLESTPVKLRSDGSISSVDGGSAGFWITSSDPNDEERWIFDSPSKAIGTRLPAGTYQVYPNLPRNADTATVAVTVTLRP